MGCENECGAHWEQCRQQGNRENDIENTSSVRTRGSRRLNHIRNQQATVLLTGSYQEQHEATQHIQNPKQALLTLSQLLVPPPLNANEQGALLNPHRWKRRRSVPNDLRWRYI